MNTAKKYLFLVLFYAAYGAGQTAAVDSALNAIESMHMYGQYLAVELESRRMLEQQGLSDSAKVQLEKWIAFSLIAQGKSSLAKDRFVSLLQLDERFELDPVLTSPKILSVFNDAKAKIMSLRRNAAMDTINASINFPSVTGQTISLRTIAFPGWEQLHQGREAAGYFYLSAGAFSLTTGIIFEILRADAREKYLRATVTADINTKYNTYNHYRKGELYSFAAFATFYLLSEFDVFTQGSYLLWQVNSPDQGSQLMLHIPF